MPDAVFLAGERVEGGARGRRRRRFDFFFFAGGVFFYRERHARRELSVLFPSPTAAPSLSPPSPTGLRFRPCRSSKRRRREAGDVSKRARSGRRADSALTETRATFSPAWCPLVSSISRPDSRAPVRLVRPFSTSNDRLDGDDATSVGPGAGGMEVENRRRRSRARAKERGERERARFRAREEPKAAVGGEQELPDSLLRYLNLFLLLSFFSSNSPRHSSLLPTQPPNHTTTTSTPTGALRPQQHP